MKQPEPAATAALLSVLKDLYPLSPEAERYLRSHVEPCTIAKRKLLLKEGITCEHVYCVVKERSVGVYRPAGKSGK